MKTEDNQKDSTTFCLSNLSDKMLVKLIKDVDTYTYHDYCQDRAIVHKDPYQLKGFGE